MKTAICVIIKDEQDYLDEWLDYHLNLGIDEIYLYEDYGSLSHSTIAEKYGDRAHLNSIDVIFQNNFNWFREYSPKKDSLIQEKLFFWFPITYKEQFDWILFIDLDEFLILKQPLHQLLDEYTDKSGILLNWRWYGANGHIKKPEGKVMDNYTKHVTINTKWRYNFKSFLNCKNFQRWEQPTHKVEGAVFPLTEFGIHKAYLNHYFTKSWEEWKTKILVRGDLITNNRKIEEFFNFNQDLLPLKNDLLLEITNGNTTK